MNAHTPCPSRWYDVRCVVTGPHTEHTDGHAVRWPKLDTREDSDLR